MGENPDLKRRLKNIDLEIGMRESYIEGAEPKTWTNEVGVGRSYVARRKQRFGAIHTQRIQEFKDDLVRLKRNRELLI